MDPQVEQALYEGMRHETERRGPPEVQHSARFPIHQPAAQRRAHARLEPQETEPPQVAVQQMSHSGAHGVICEAEMGDEKGP